ncbi:Abi family protein [bacterium]|nr:Abi family protein [bacterium]
MEYTKTPISVEEQIEKLEKRGLNFSDKKSASEYLENISYYRLRAFTYPFQNNTDPEADHAFVRNDIYFEDIIDLYVFDRRLRNLIFNELEKIEIAVRTKLSLVYSVAANDSWWFKSEGIYQKGKEAYEKLMESIKSDVKRSNEDFIKHYKKKYSSPETPPSWMTLEVVSFGTLSHLYEMLKNTKEKRQIARAFGIADEDVFANWLHAFSNLRNNCAHHNRIWNRRFIINMQLPYNTTKPFIAKNDLTQLKRNKIFVLLCAIKYIADILSPGNSFKKNLISLLNDRHRLLTLKEMGFPADWEKLPVWQ